MLKKFKHFLIKESLSKLTKEDLIPFDDNKRYFFGLQEFGGYDDPTTIFEGLHDHKFYLSFYKLSYIDDSGQIREDIKIGEDLVPCIYLEIKAQPGSKANDDVIADIKKVLKKTRSITKYGSKYDFKNIVVSDPFIEDRDSDNFNVLTDVIKSEDPLSEISVENGSIIYTDINEEDSYISSSQITICLYGDEKVKITPEMFYVFYHMSDAEYKDNKDGNLWVRLDLRKILDIVFKDDTIDKYYKPIEDDYDYLYDVELEHILDDVINYMSSDHRERLITIITTNITLDEINETLGEEYESLEEVSKNISDEDISSLLEEYNHIDEVGYIISSYNSYMTDKLVIKIRDYIIDTIKDYMNKYMEFEYILSLNDSYDEEDDIYIKYDPVIFEDNNWYNEDNELSKWSTWSNIVRDSSIYDSITEFIYDHKDQESLYRGLGDNIYLDESDINSILNDIL